MVKEIDLGKDLEKVVTLLKGEYGDEFAKVSGDIWNILIDKAEAEAYDKIKMVPKGQGVVAYGVLYRWLTDVSGLCLAEQARMLMHPVPPKKEEDLAEHVERSCQSRVKEISSVERVIQKTKREVNEVRATLGESEDPS